MNIMKFDKNAVAIFKVAMEHCESLVSDTQWAQVRVEPGNILVDYGVIHSNGEFERAIATRAYYIVPKSGVVHYNEFVHL